MNGKDRSYEVNRDVAADVESARARAFRDAVVAGMGDFLRRFDFRENGVADWTCVLFGNGLVDLMVEQDSPGDSVDACLSLAGKRRWFGAGSIACWAGCEPPHSHPGSDADISRVTEILAGFLSTHAAALLRGDAAAFAGVAAAAKRADDEAEKERVQRARLHAAESAYDDGDFTAVKQLLEPHAEDLTAAERVLLRRAQLQVGD